jgi:hypothetical protein
MQIELQTLRPFFFADPFADFFFRRMLLRMDVNIHHHNEA